MSSPAEPPSPPPPLPPPRPPPAQFSIGASTLLFGMIAMGIFFIASILWHCCRTTPGSPYRRMFMGEDPQAARAERLARRARRREARASERDRRRDEINEQVLARLPRTLFKGGAPLSLPAASGPSAGSPALYQSRSIRAVTRMLSRSRSSVDTNKPDTLQESPPTAQVAIVLPLAVEPPCGVAAHGAVRSSVESDSNSSSSFENSATPLCPVCLEGLMQNEEVSALSCGHTLHVECIEQWIRVGPGVHPSCPVCRLDLAIDLLHDDIPPLSQVPSPTVVVNVAR